MKTPRSQISIAGVDRASHRAFYRAMGLSDEDLTKPLVGIVSFRGEQTPCNMTHGFQADAARLGIAAAGGVPREFFGPSVSDGTSMNHEGMKIDRKSVV